MAEPPPEDNLLLLRVNKDPPRALVGPSGKVAQNVTQSRVHEGEGAVSLWRSRCG